MKRADDIQSSGNIDQNYDTMTQNLPTVDSYNINEDVISDNAKQQQQPMQHTFANKDTTKMPRAIVEAMINNPIEVPTPGSFQSSPELVNAVRKAEGKPRQRKTTKTDIDGIREIIREELENVIDSYIDKRLLNEEIQVKVGNTIFSGNLKPLPKRKKKK